MPETDPSHEAFLAALQSARIVTDASTLENWNRSLPFADAFFDRWERANRLGFGDRASIYDSAYVYGDVHVGTHTWVGPMVILDGSGGPLRIGDWCSISAGVQIYTHDTVAWALSMGRAPYHHAPVTIGSGCHIGASSIIAAGVTIGDRCVVGANSFVRHDVLDDTVVAGTPARTIGRVTLEGTEVRIVSESDPSHPSRPGAS